MVSVAPATFSPPPLPLSTSSVSQGPLSSGVGAFEFWNTKPTPNPFLSLHPGVYPFSPWGGGVDHSAPHCTLGYTLCNTLCNTRCNTLCSTLCNTRGPPIVGAEGGEDEESEEEGEGDAPEFIISYIEKHKGAKGRRECMVHWEGHTDITWEPVSNIDKENPALVDY